MTSTTSKTTSRPPSIAAIALGLGLAAVLLAGETRAEDARAVVQRGADDVLVILRDDSLSLDQKREKIEDIAYDTFDFERMSKLALARSYKKLDADQRVQFKEEFKRHLALTYGRSLETYSDEGIAIGNTREHKNGDVTVLGKVVGGKHDGATIDWRMRTRDDTWKVIDVIIEGVSLIANFRSQVQEIVKSRGPAALIMQLRDKNDAEELKDP
ncbi:MAG: ABC transporter substrate-binding protein [Deltaproteobacteria bacterium]|nr:ABC transporter substrate-binding protein [Deltaproteobacteria bacterium]